MFALLNLVLIWDLAERFSVALIAIGFQSLSVLLAGFGMVPNFIILRVDSINH
jgi:hypothetical protein